jgi:hypothetical protein
MRLHDQPILLPDPEQVLDVELRIGAILQRKEDAREDGDGPSSYQQSDRQCAAR